MNEAQKIDGDDLVGRALRVDGEPWIDDQEQGDRGHPTEDRRDVALAGHFVCLPFRSSGRTMRPFSIVEAH